MNQSDYVCAVSDLSVPLSKFDMTKPSDFYKVLQNSVHGPAQLDMLSTLHAILFQTGFCFAFLRSYIFISDEKVKAKSNRNRN